MHYFDGNTYLPEMSTLLIEMSVKQVCAVHGFSHVRGQTYKACIAEIAAQEVTTSSSLS
jgi:hypothetical protein